MNKGLYYREAGEGQPIVFLHGMLGSGLYWREQMELLKNHHHVIALDLLGFGRSPKPSNLKYDRDDHINYILKTLDAIGIKTPITLVGHSMGALLALSLTTKYPERISRLVLISMPIYKNATEAQREITQSKIVPRFMYYGPTARVICSAMGMLRPLSQILAPLYFKHLPKDVARDATRHTWFSYSRSMENIIENQNVLADLRKVKVPVLVLFGAKDAVVKSTNLEEIKLCCKDIEVRLLNATHHLPLEAPKQTAQFINNMIEKPDKIRGDEL